MKLLYYYASILLLLSSSCSKDNEQDNEPIYSACNKSKIVQTEFFVDRHGNKQAEQSTYEYSYNDRGRIESIFANYLDDQTYVKGKASFKYSKDKIEYYNFKNSLIWDLQIDNNERIISGRRYSDSGYPDNYEFKYSNEGYLIEIKEYDLETNQLFNTKIFNYLNGNLSDIIVTKSARKDPISNHTYPSTTEITRFDYHKDKASIKGYDLVLNAVLTGRLDAETAPFIFQSHLLGKQSKNLLKSITYYYDTPTEAYTNEITYKYNSDQVIAIASDDSNFITDITYNCK